MGRRGPAPKPKELLQARRSRRARLIDHETKPELPEAARPPACPKWLDADAKRMWKSVVPHLDMMKIVIKVDRAVLARYCQSWSRWKRAELFLQKYGETFPIKDSAGRMRYLCPWPQVAIAHQLSLSLTRLEQELGLTPSARTRLDPKLCRPWLDPVHAVKMAYFFGPEESRPKKLPKWATTQSESSAKGGPKPFDLFSGGGRQPPAW